ncbi:hypothetical protein [Falsiroseomonas sp.]|uniref:hypothetical protein n=1 Tax=Falsiroseomonas sp. TaxID=2870721 RepID=UPI003F7246D9
MSQTEQDKSAPVPPAEKRAIVMLSVGERDWRGHAAATFERYAERCGARLHVETALPDFAEFPLPDLPDTSGRPNKRAYACKTFFAWKHLQAGYDRVLFVDDTCCVRLGTPDLFDLVPRGALGGVGSSKLHAQLSFDDITRFVARRGCAPIEMIHDEYMNSGVLVYDRSFMAAIAPKRVIDAKRLLMSKLPHQTLTYYLIKSRGIPFHVLPRIFNTVPAAKLDRPTRRSLDDIRPHLDHKAFIYHLTGIYRQRGALVQQIADILLNEDLAAG